MAQQVVKVQQVKGQKKVEILVGDKLVTSFLYPDSLEKPVLYPINAPDGKTVTRGFPYHPIPDEPTDHPHHLGSWLNFENVNGLDFWNNSFAIPSEKKHLYGWIKTDSILQLKSGKKGILQYHANWVDFNNNILLSETTTFQFSIYKHQFIIDRKTELKAVTDVLFKDSKDGMFAIRVAHELQMPIKEMQQFVDDKGNITYVKPDFKVPTGNYLTSEGKEGNDAWGSRGTWCKLTGKMGTDSVSIVLVDHPQNPNYPTFWFTRGYGLFAANPLGEKIFTKGKSSKNLQLKKGESTTFNFRMIIHSNSQSITAQEINKLRTEFIH